MSVFSWLRTQIRNAVLGGFADAIQILKTTEEPESLLLEYRSTSEQEESTEPTTSIGNGKPKGRKGATT